MNVPNFVYEKFIDDLGELSPGWRLFFNQLITQMQQTVGNQGFVMPSLKATQIALLTNAQDGTMIYDSTNNTPVVRKNGVFVPFP